MDLPEIVSDVIEADYQTMGTFLDLVGRTQVSRVDKIIQPTYSLYNNLYSQSLPLIREQINKFGGIRQDHPTLDKVLFLLIAHSFFEGYAHRLNGEEGVLGLASEELESTALTPRSGKQKGILVYDVQDLQTLGKFLGYSKQIPRTKSILYQARYLE
jgi:hypothetical protein